MICSEARLAANRANALKSRGPTTELGKLASRRNGLKHGLSGEGIVVLEGDAEEIGRRAEALRADMKPRTSAGLILIQQMATLSVRAERAAEREIAETAMRVRNAAEAFDEGRIDRANALFDGLADNPREALRKLRRMPEGVERLVDAWHDLRADLAIEPESGWDADQLERAANLAGLKARHARGSRLGAFARAIQGDFAALAEGDGGDLDDEARRGWAQAALFDHVDAEILALEEHYETLDFETIEIDRAEAGRRALFDASKGASLARRYESEARRGFFKALKEFRLVEAESEAKAQPSPAGPLTAPPSAGMGSSRQTSPPPGRIQVRPYSDFPLLEDSTVRGDAGQPIRAVRPASSPG